MDPLKIEQAYSRLTTEIQRAGSERVQLFLIYEFIGSLQGDYQTFDSYLIQLFDLFPSLEHPLLFTGLHPAKLEEVISVCEEVLVAIPEIKNDEVERKINLLKTGLHHICDWLGISHVEKDNRLPSLSDLSKKPKEKEKTYGEVFIPVVETSGAIEAKGRLRKLRVDVVGKAKGDQFELRPVFGVIGANPGNIGDKPAKAAGKLLKESITTKNTWSGTASFELSHIWHAGNSANLALGGLFYCEMLKAENRREYFQLNPGIAITGDIDDEGKVLAVDDETLKQKTEAAFFSWAQVLVVPVQQLEIALEFLEVLQEIYPQRNLLVKGIGELRELFYDRRLTLHKQESIVTHAANKVWKKRNSAVAVLIFLIMLGVIGRLIYGPVDKNPVSLEFEGTSMIVKNTFGNLLFNKEIGNFMVLGARSDVEARYRYSKLIDVNNDGLNEVIWVSQKEREDYLGRSVLYAADANGDTLWSRSFNQSLKFEFHPYISSDLFLIRYIYAADLDSDGSNELIVITTHEQYFPSFLYVLNPENGEIEKSLMHHGYIERALFKDLNQDGLKEIIYAGINNTYKLAFMAVVSYNELKGQSGDSGRYFLDNKPQTNETAYVLFPQSIIGKTLWGRNGIKTTISELYVRGKKNMFILRIIEFIERNNADVAEFVTLQYNFNDSLEITHIAPGDDYDLKAQQLYQEGKLDFMADGKYLQQLKDSLLWWNGETFQHKPTMNKEYLRAGGVKEAIH